MRNIYSSIDEYMEGFPKSTQKMLSAMRKTIQSAAPNATEKISYAMPTFYLHGNLVHFAGYKSHIGFYPAPSGLKNFEKEIATFKNSKGAVQFPLDKPLPIDLIKKIVRFRVQENMAKAESKKKIRICKNGHQYYKSSDCPTCPVCEKDQKPKEGFLSLLSAPARRALESKGIKTLMQLSSLSEKGILALHGIGPKAIPILKNEMKEHGLKFKDK
jgi:uncharacterized protein YdhG (YjbR/CyaY superfamily)